eukprot:CAMPEP_0201516608 /NCGR_PEP_ID=MMETSP0161_2-20130828/7900_1 /ASSEMBLY_ACC=CAM_ASM_000251 /TAXON_ID=180227 /ORGANISM="Neoparamoeba aestuarina, Strain SoJaBio B1-5/56/2" /LENGTH=410 /DNA_ID=CAMNT_0047913803 /DNA_START=755 /DNA_END=1983 /DNA_ORIENTATION=+
MEREKLASFDKCRRQKVMTKLDMISGLDKEKSNNPLLRMVAEDGSRSFLTEKKVVLATKEAGSDPWKETEAILLLFSDILIITTKREKEKNPPLILFKPGVIPLSLLTLSSSSAGDSPASIAAAMAPEKSSDTPIESATVLHMSMWKEMGDQDFFFTFPSETEKSDFLSSFVPQYETYHACYGRKIPELLAFEEVFRIPHIVRACLKILMERKAYLTEGLFRVSGSVATMIKIKAMFDSWKPSQPDLTLANFETVDIASSLKVWFRELPEPIMTTKIFHNYVMKDKEIKPQVILEAIPETSRTVLFAIIRFNLLLIQHSEQNKMTPANIAVCWAPAILRPKRDSIEASLRVPQAIKVIETILNWAMDNQDYLGPDYIFNPQEQQKQQLMHQNLHNIYHKRKKGRGGGGGG